MNRFACLLPRGLIPAALALLLLMVPTARVLALPPPAQLFSLCWAAYSPTHYNPNTGVSPSAASIRQDLQTLLAAGFNGIVTYGADGVLGTLVPQIAQEVGFTGMIMGVWDPTSSTELANAVAAKDYSVVVGYSVGNEGLNVRYTLAQLEQAMQYLRDQTGKPVTTTEELGDYLPPNPLSSTLLSLGDWIFPNVHPYFAGILDPAQAVDWTVARYHDFQGLTTRPVLFKEVGLPSDGDTNNILSEEGQAVYYRLLWNTDVPFVYFEAFDQYWKTALPVEPHWGIFRSDRTPKRALASICGREGVPVSPQPPEPGARDGIGMYARANGTWYLRRLPAVGAPDFQIAYGGAWAAPVVGDWNGDGYDNVGVYDSSNGNWYLRNTNSAGTPDITVIGYGGDWGLPVSGDWNGNGTDTIGLFVPSTGEWLLRNSDSYGTPDLSFTFGGSWGYPVIGDWDGDGIDTAGIYNPTDGNWYLRNRHSSGGADIVIIGYGGWWGFPIVGDWNGDGVDTIGVFAYQTGQWLLRNSNSYGTPQIQLTYGGDWGTPIAGDWYGLGALSAETSGLLPFNENWDTINQLLSTIGTAYSLVDLLRFSLDPSSPLGATPTLMPAPPPATIMPVPAELPGGKPTPPTMPQG